MNDFDFFAKGSFMLATFLLILGIALLYMGAELVVKGASNLAKKYQISPLIFGVTVVAFSTSLPEAVTSFAAQLNGQRGDICLGNIIGSNIANLGLILGVSALLFPIHIKKEIRSRESWLCLIMTVIVLAMMFFGTITRIDGLILLILFVIFVVYQILLAKKQKQTSAKITSSGRAIWIPIGIILLCLGGYCLIEGAIELATIIGLSERVIGLTVVAIGTSSPELFTSLVAAYRKESEIALGNIIGSNIFNLSFVLGGGASIFPVSFSSQLLNCDMSVLLAFTLFFLWITQKRQKIGRKSSLFLLAGYIGYIVFLLT